jgi:hypothetical protein
MLMRRMRGVLRSRRPGEKPRESSLTSRFVEEALSEVFGGILVECELLCAKRVPERREAGFRPGDGRAGFQARDESEPDGLVVVEAVEWSAPGHGNLGHADGKEECGFVTSDGGLEVFWSDADDGEGGAVDADSLIDDGK